MAMNKKLLIGYHTNANRFFDKSPSFDVPAKRGGGVDFILCHIDPLGNTLKESCEKARTAAKAIKELGVDFIANFEEQNFCYESETPDGFDWGTHSEGVHRLDIPAEFLKALASAGNFLGVMYDEFEHVIINRNLSIRMSSKYRLNPPVFKNADTKNVTEQGDLLNGQLKEYKEKLLERGAVSLSGEHVFPVLFHTFARNGIIPNFKSQKESFSNVQFACAAGAALQYGTELWNCVDMWYRLTFPGHSAKELSKNLEFAYHAGVNRVYVESSQVFFEKGSDEFNENGRAFADFTEKYRGKDRDYDVQDYKPEIGIIKYDDSFWGQGRPGLVMWNNMLLGNPKLKVDGYAREWVRAMNIITHGETGNGGVSWGKIELRSLRKHRSFASMNGAAVFDDKVRKESLESLKLCFLCGREISAETLSDVRELVRENGLTVVTTAKYMPKDLKAEGVLIAEAKDGSGVWIKPLDLRLPQLRKRLAAFTGNKGEMTYRFGDRLLKMKIDKDGEGFELI